MRQSYIHHHTLAVAAPRRDSCLLALLLIVLVYVLCVVGLHGNVRMVLVFVHVMGVSEIMAVLLLSMLVYVWAKNVLFSALWCDLIAHSSQTP